MKRMLRGNIIGKLLEAVGIASLMIALVSGFHGDEWGELYLFIGGIVTFVIGRQVEKRWEKKHETTARTNSLHPEH